MAPHRRNIGASRRRRREDDGEEGGSVAGELDDDSLSEGTELSHQEEDDADGESSDGSEEGKASTSTPQADRVNGQVNGRVSETTGSPEKSGKESTVSDTEAMMGELGISAGSEGVAETEREEQKRQLQQQHQQQEGRASVPPPDSRRDPALGDRKRREQEREPKERDKNPAVVPTRGSFFLHDKRSTETGSNGSNSNSRSFNKPKSRPHGLIVDGNAPRNPPKSDASRGPWTHDLHDTVAGDEPASALKPSTATNMGPNAGPPVASNPVPTAPRSSPPNRSFSNTILIGNVPAVVFLPGMSQPTPVRAVPKKQHTRLPQHRPPLRRDKPVRISLPGQQPRYIFPSTERSFIFIPRALRPNQQAYRGRGGRGGFFGGRRSSIYANSAYSPSVSLSRRSSLGRGMPPEGFHSPAGSVLPKAAVMAGDNSKPVVRLPPTRPPPGGFPPVPGAAGPPMPGAVPAAMPPPPHPHHHPLPPQPQYPAYRESRPAPIPMHQPRPQKTVSVADIETPAAYGFNPPQPQQEQPFHHQVPVPAGAAATAANGAAYPPDASGPPPPPPLSTHTPLSHIPERAIHAQPFQPYDFSQQQQQQQPPPQQQAFYPPTYPPGSMYYPVSGAEYPPYNAAMGPAPSFVPSSGPQMPYMMPAATVPPPASMAEQQPSQTGTVAHEAGGTVYFYDASQMYQNPYAAPAPAPPGPGGVVGMGGMMTPPGTGYYYPPAPGGVYYG